MKKSKWPGFLFAISVRFVCGIVLGGLASFVFGWKGILRAFSHDDTGGPLIWLGLCGLTGGIVAVFTVPHWQTPWYRRDSEGLNLWEEGASLSQNKTRPVSTVVRKSVRIKTVDEGGQVHEYSSMEEAPPEMRSQIEAVEKEAAQEIGKELAVTETPQTADAITSTIIRQKNISVYKIVDESGAERVYHSLEEMPPEVRAAVAEAEQKLKG